MPPKSSKPRDDPKPVEPVYQRSPERGVLCYEFLINNYLRQWLTAKTINAHFYTKATEELEALKKSKYGKQVAAQKPDQSDIEAVANLQSTPPPGQRHNPSASGVGRGIRNSNNQPRHQHSITPPNHHSRTGEAGAGNKGGRQKHQPTVQSAQQHHSKREVGDTRGVIERPNVSEQKSALQIIKLENANKQLTDETNKLYADVAALDNEKRQLEERIENLKTQLHGAYENVNDLRLRLSKLAGDNMRSNNPNLADLSDPYRPTELGKMFGEIYDNEWSDAFEVARGSTEKDKINVLYNILMDTYKFCIDIFQRQTTIIDGCLINPAIQNEISDGDNELKGVEKKNVEFKNALKDRRKQLARITAKQIAEVYSQYELPKEQGLDKNERLPPKLIKYASKCCELCWFMVISDPPLVFSEEKYGHEFVSDIFRPFTRSKKDMGKPVIEMVVWPALYLHFEGELLSKGVAQPISGEGHKTK